MGNEFWINKNYFRIDKLYDNSVPRFKTMNGNFPFVPNHVIKYINDALNS